MLSGLDLRQFSEVREARRAWGAPFVIAHRGASAVAPENTLFAFALAVQQGANVIETDLWFSRDRELILIHDRNLKRTTGRDGFVTDLTSDDVLTTTVEVPQRSAPEPQTVPALTALLELAANANIALLLELKDPRFSIPSWARILVTLLAENDFMSRVMITSFSTRCLLGIRDVCPELPVGPVAKSMFLPDCSWDFVGPAWPNLVANPSFTWHAHRGQTLVTPLDLDPVKRMPMYASRDVDAVLTDEVEATLDALNTWS